MTEPTEPAGLETTLPDLSRIPLRELLSREDLGEDVAAVVEQVARPRVNLGGSGPPGRAD